MKKNQKNRRYDRADADALRASNIAASLLGTSGKRYDSVEDASVFFARELDFVKSHAYDKQYPEFTALGLFPVSNEVDPGAESITYYAYDKTGIAKIISNYATDLPRADVKGEPHTAQVKSVGASYGYSVQEMRASRMAGKNLDGRKADAARYAIDYTLNRIAWAGDDETGLQGVLSSGNDVPLYVIPAGASGKTDWNSKTAEEIMVDINGMQKYTARITKNVERPDTLCLPDDVFIDISTRQIPNTGYTVAKFIMENAPYLKRIVPASELAADSDINPYDVNCAFMFKKDPDKFTFEQPLMFYQYPVQPKNLEITVPCEARTGGIMIYFPLSMLIAKGV